MSSGLISIRWRCLPWQGKRFSVLVSGGAGLVYAGGRDDVKQFATEGANDDPFRAAFNNDAKTDVAGKHGLGVMVAINPVDFGNRLDDERYLFATMNAMLSASLRRSGLDLTGIQFAGKSIPQESMTMMTYRVDFINDSPPRQMDIHQRYIDRYGRVAFERTERFNVASGRSFMQLDYPLLPAGDYTFELVFADDRGAVAIAGTSFKVTSETRLTALYPWYASVPNGGYIPCTVELSTTILADMRFEAELVDMYGRIIDRSIPNAIPGWKSSTFSLYAADIPGRMATLRVYYWRSNLLVDIMETPVYIEKYYDPRDFSFVAGDSGMSLFFRERGIRRLADSGAGWIVADMSALSPGIQYQRGADILCAGAGIIPSLGGIVDIDTGAAYALADTLRHFAPPAYVISAGSGAAVTRIPEGFDLVQTALVNADSTVRAGMSAIRFNSSVDVEHVTGISDLILAEEPEIGGATDMMLLASIDMHAWPDAITGTVVRSSRDTGEETVRELPWRNLFAGLNSIWWERGEEDAAALFLPDGSLSPAAAALADAVSTIGGGVGRLLLGSEPVESPEWLDIATVPEAESRYITRVFKDGDSWYIGLLLPVNAGMPKVTVNADFSALGAAPAVYDVRKGEFLGITSSVSLELEAGDAAVLALMPEAARDVTITGITPIASPGESFSLGVNVRNRSGGEATGRRVFRIEVSGPDGSPRPWMTKLAETGIGAEGASCFIAHNDPPGQWTLTATDIASGRRTERRFIVRRTGAGGM